MFQRMVTKLKFRTQYDRLRVQSKNVGSKIKHLRHGRFDQFGRIELIEDGEQNWYGLIQSDKDSCDLNKIIEKYMITGDASLFMQRPQSGYIDVRQMPKTTVDLLNVYNDALSVFEKLPLEERAKYNHDFYQYFASLEFSAGEQIEPSVPKEEEKKVVKTDE